jgi:hypothetical protein
MLSDNFIRAVPFDALCSAIPAHHVTVGIDQEDRVIRHPCYQVSERFVAKSIPEFFEFAWKS